ncbi:hypothetical protein MAHJHV34_47250 [Mycobacterium avium subsp. hominissuis]
MTIRYGPAYVIENQRTLTYGFAAPDSGIECRQRLRETGDALCESAMIVGVTIRFDCGESFGEVVSQVLQHHAGKLRALRRMLNSESPWFRWRLGLLDFDQGLVGPFRSVERGFELCGR